ncbi:hypothetical protein ZEAMMB73_Zm00001d011617 [Zea mays]|uniref:Zinc transporter 5 n=3 Tax=Zea mays TaxID=4577 RepID=A0A1D6G2F3_MAIZE|nr:hypothetical protein ZEAMMB73_Zm00001d011617 [Zea mays]AQK97570.1 hypothetical protein ZEAMMB73_Zm00001d011617 [Zea mays]
MSSSGPSPATGTHHTRSTPLQVIHVLGNFMRIWSVYSLYSYLSNSGDSIVGFIFSCLVPTSVIFLVLQKPWKGRPLPNSQVVPTVVNGGILAFYFVLWGKGLLACGPLVMILNTSTEKQHFITINHIIVLYWQSMQVLFLEFSLLLYMEGNLTSGKRQIGGLAAMLAAYYLLSNGWSTRTHSPLYSFGSEPVEKAAQTIGVKAMMVPITAGILSALRRVLARRVSLKNQLKRRLHAITIASATCFLFPFAMWDTILGSASDSIVKLQLPSWAYFSTVLFGMVLIFYVDNVAEEKLHLVFSSPRHLMVSTGCIIVLETVYQMDFSLLGFLVCSVILGFGISEATSLERSKKSPLETHELSNGVFHNQLPISELPS